MNKLSPIAGYSNNNINSAASFQGRKSVSANIQSQLERMPQKDSVSFNGKLSEKELNPDLNIEASENFFSGKRKIKGTILDKKVDLKLSTGFLDGKVRLSGTIDGIPVDLSMSDYKLSGEISEQHKDMLPYIKRIMTDKRRDDKQDSDMMNAIAISAAV